MMNSIKINVKADSLKSFEDFNEVDWPKLHCNPAFFLYMLAGRWKDAQTTCQWQTISDICHGALMILVGMENDALADDLRFLKKIAQIRADEPSGD